MRGWDFFPLLLLLVALPLWTVLRWAQLARQLRWKGHGGVVSNLLLACSLGIWLWLSYALSTLCETYAVGGAMMRAFVFPIASFGWSFLGWVALQLLPRRAERGGGTRRPRLRFAWLGRVARVFAAVVLLPLLVAAMLLLLLSIPFHPRGAAQSGRALRGLANLTSKVFRLGNFWQALGRRLETYPDAVPDGEPLVLYLRSFEDEGRPFVRGPRGLLGKYSNSLGVHLASSARERVTLTFEDYLGEELGAALCAFVALGNPLDYVPPEGARREYATDATWQERFQVLSLHARCIVVEAGGSPNLVWELAQLRERGLLRKLYFFTRPELLPRASLRMLWESFCEWRPGNRGRPWAALNETLRAAGYAFALPDPGPGAVVTLGGAGEPILLTAQARLPPDYVAPIASWVNAGIRTGRYLLRPCSACGKPCYQAPAVDGLCLSCEQVVNVAALARAGVGGAAEGGRP